VVNGVPVTTPLRTACDLGRLRRRRDAFVALNALAAHGAFGRIEVSIETGRFKGMRGVVQLRALARILTSAVESPAESVVLLQILDAGLPEPEAQLPILSRRGVLRYRLDLAYRSIKLAIGMTVRSTIHRRNSVSMTTGVAAISAQLGWTLVVLTKDDVYGPEPSTAAILRAAIAQAHLKVDRLALD
jgi:hypothetical protein